MLRIKSPMGELPPLPSWAMEKDPNLLSFITAGMEGNMRHASMVSRAGDTASTIWGGGWGWGWGGVDGMRMVCAHAGCRHDKMRMGELICVVSCCFLLEYCVRVLLCMLCAADFTYTHAVAYADPTSSHATSSTTHLFCELFDKDQRSNKDVGISNILLKLLKVVGVTELLEQVSDHLKAHLGWDE